MITVSEHQQYQHGHGGYVKAHLKVVKKKTEIYLYQEFEPRAGGSCGNSVRHNDLYNVLYNDPIWYSFSSVFAQLLS